MTTDSTACTEYNRLSRRGFLQLSGATMIALGLPSWLPRVAFAKDFDATRQVVVSIFLRGGADGLTLCVPFGDPLYYAATGPTARPTLAVPPPGSANGCTSVDGFFGLHPSMAPLMEAYNNQHLAIVHAAGMNDPTRSHFDAQRFMETGQPGQNTLATGWLGRHLGVVPPLSASAPMRGVGVGLYGLPASLQGGPLSLPVPDIGNFNITGPSGTRAARLAAINSMYQATADPLRSAASTAQATISMLAALGFSTYVPGGGAVYPSGSFGTAMRSAACLIKGNVGVEAIAVDIGGWDTHAAQGNAPGGGMSNLMNTLAQGILAFYRDVFASTTNVVVVVMSEFGRRPLENASLGTDHGHGNVMFLLGGTINGGRVFAKTLQGQNGWVGLGSLYQNLDLHTTIDYRNVVAEILQNCAGNSNLGAVFPGFTPTFLGVTR